MSVVRHFDSEWTVTNYFLLKDFPFYSLCSIALKDQYSTLTQTGAKSYSCFYRRAESHHQK